MTALTTQPFDFFYVCLALKAGVFAYVWVNILTDEDGIFGDLDRFAQNRFTSTIYISLFGCVACNAFWWFFIEVTCFTYSPNILYQLLDVWFYCFLAIFVGQFIYSVMSKLR